jgi:uncharacterized protein with HEPN domain
MSRRVAKEYLHLRNWLIHQYDQIDRNVTWATLTRDLSVWEAALRPRFSKAEARLADESP